HTLAIDVRLRPRSPLNCTWSRGSTHDQIDGLERPGQVLRKLLKAWLVPARKPSVRQSRSSAPGSQAMPLKRNPGHAVAQHAARRRARATREETKPYAESFPGTDGWRHDNIGRLLNNAVRRFEDRVLELMAEAGYADARISHLNLTRNLDRDGTRLTELAARA